jgi:hypothetical protein
MDLTVTTVCSAPSVATKVAVLLLVSYPFVFWLATRRQRAFAGTAFPATLIPIFVGLTATWLAVAQLHAGLAIVGDGQMSRGIAEAQLTLWLGSVVATLVNVIAICREVIASRRRDAAEPEGQPSSGRVLSATMVAAVLVLTLIEIGQAVFMLRPVVIVAASAQATSVAAAGLSVGGALVSMWWLWWLVRHGRSQPRRMRFASSVSCLLGSIGLSLAIWEFMQRARAIVTGGG